MSTKVIGYVRVSSEEQAAEGVSLDAQTAKIRAYCGLYDLELVGIECDAGLSAKTLRRPALQRALSALKAKQADGILVCKLDRLTRSVQDLNDLVTRYFTKWQLISIGEQISTTTASGRMVLNLLTSVGQWEREAIGERTSTALQHLRSQGRRVSGKIPYGYALASDGRTLCEDPGEQAVIVRARRAKASGMSLRAISAALAESGLLSRAGKAFVPCAVGAMVR